MAHRKIFLGLGCVAFLAFVHVGCSGLVGDVCQRACDCQSNCDHNSEAICEDDALDVQAKVEAAGCDKLFDDLLDCELTASCRGPTLDASKCQAKNDAVQRCIEEHTAPIQ